MSNDPAELARSVLALVRAGRNDDALQTSTTLMAITRPGERLRLTAVEPLFLAGRIDEAAALCDEIADVEPTAVQPLRMKAQLANRSGRSDLLSGALAKLFALARTVPDLNWIADHIEAAGWSDLPLDQLHANLTGGTVKGRSVQFALLLVMLNRPADARPLLDAINSQSFRNPDVLIASAIACAAAGDAKSAQAHTGEALQLRPVVLSPTENGDASLLIVTDLIRGHFDGTHKRLGAAAYHSGNFPTEIRPGRLDIHLLQLQTSALDKAIDALPKIDVVLANLAWAGAEPSAGAIGVFDHLVRRLGAVALNHPRDHIAMSRDANYKRWADAAEFIFPKTILTEVKDGDVTATAARIEDGFTYPFIVRPTFTQIGVGMVLVENAEALAQALTDMNQRSFYVIQYHESVSDGGYYRRYRAAIIDGRPIPYRLDTRPHWMVHRQKNEPGYIVPPESIEEEIAMFQDYKSTLSTATVTAIEKVAREGPLDIFGIDFGHTTDGQVIIYEANAIMNLIPYRFAATQSHFGPIALGLQAAIEDAVIRRRAGDSRQIS